MLTKDNFKHAVLSAQEIEEKAEIRRAGLYIGIASISLFGVSQEWSYAYFFITDFLKISRNAAADFITTPAATAILQIVLTTLMFSVPFLIIAKLMGKQIDDIVPFKAPEKGTALPMICFGLGACGFASIANFYAEEILENFGVEYEVNFPENPTGFWGFLLAFFSTAVFPALMEEFGCRGIIFGLLKPMGGTFAVVSSAAVFGLMHGNFEQIPFAFLVGLALGVIRLKTDSIWPCFLIHFANNALSVVMDYVGKESGTADLVYTLILAVYFILGIFGICTYFLRAKNSEKALENQEKEGQKYLWFFLSPAMVIFVLVALVISCSYFF